MRFGGVTRWAFLMFGLTAAGSASAADADPDARATVRAEHTLVFVRRGGKLAPDAASAILMEKLGWSPDQP